MNKFIRKFIGVTPLLWITLAGAAQGPQWQSHESIRAAAADAVSLQWSTPGGRVDVVADQLDSRIRLAACNDELAVSIPYKGRKANRVTAQVRCAGPKPWKLHVPVRLTVFESVVIANRALPRDGLLTAADVSLAERDTGALDYGYLSAVDDAVGQRLRRPLAAGEAIAPGALEMPHLVRRGQQVTLHARSGGMQIRMAGVAQANGIKGQVIAVQNLSSGREVEGIVRSAKSVEVLLQ